MKRKNLRFAIVLLLVGLLICPASAASSFPDVDETAEYAEAVEYLKDVGIMKGDDQGNFNPDKTVTRAEMATIVCNMLGETDDLSVSDSFTDVPLTHWANKYITKAKELGIISGYGNRKFGLNDKVTYEQAVTMIVRVGYGDEFAIDYGGYPNGYLIVAEEYGMLNGISLQKGYPMSRADISVLLYNFFTYNG